MTADDVDRLLTEIGPLDDAIVEVVRAGADRWSVRFEAIDVDVELDEPGERLVFTAAVGAPRSEDRLRIYEGLLLYNSVGRDTGGVRMALAEPGGEVLQIVDLPTPGLTPKLAATVTVNMAERALVWRNLFQAVPDAEAAQEIALPPEFLIRV